VLLVVVFKRINSFKTRGCLKIQVAQCVTPTYGLYLDS